MNSKLIFLILFLFLLNHILSIQLLSTYGSVIVTCPKDSRILFNSSYFNLNEEMYFTFTLTVDSTYTQYSKKTSKSTTTSTRTSSYFIDDEINYHFYPNNILNDPNFYYGGGTPIKSTTETSSTLSGETKYNKYYTISKNIDNDYLLIEFDCTDCTKCKKGSLKIENTKENKGKKVTII